MPQAAALQALLIMFVKPSQNENPGYYAPALKSKMTTCPGKPGLSGKF